MYGETCAEDEEDEGDALSQGEAVWLLYAICFEEVYNVKPEGRDAIGAIPSTRYLLYGGAESERKF